ncbi:cathepsin L, putative [Bodo saltans]|uniref:Cathepsin L, putative n=1 Tax=Bodo saltans TaxID=75058 RepID=A0A0S4KI32_BODSA|nr:cathepsin L, putative [Bodo saltans]|eukprot:CUI15338.1 cathepsin L, putative [Bodo saltans]
MVRAIVVVLLVTCALASREAAYHAWRTEHKIATAPSTEEQSWYEKSSAEIEALTTASPHATFKLNAKAGSPWGIPRGTLSGSASLTYRYFTNEQIETALNTSVDWQKTPDVPLEGAVTRIKNQGACGSCWAFATVAAIEGMYKQKGRSLSSFSEQYILDCLPPTVGLNGCQSGDIRTLAQLLAVGNYPLPYETNYEYLSYDNTSHACNATPVGVAKVSAAYQIGTTGTQALEDAMAAWVYNYGPIIVGVSSWQSAWQLYSSGVAECPAVPMNQLDHGVTIVGYGVMNSVPYWKVKNSWTPKWGETGYIYLRRGTNACGLRWINTVVEVQ